MQTKRFTFYTISLTLIFPFSWCLNNEEKFSEVNRSKKFQGILGLSQSLSVFTMVYSPMKNLFKCKFSSLTQRFSRFQKDTHNLPLYPTLVAEAADQET